MIAVRWWDVPFWPAEFVFDFCKAVNKILEQISKRKYNCFLNSSE